MLSFNSYSQNLKEALEQAKGNRTSLEQVLEYYSKQGDEEKYNAAIFLIENMPIHKSIDYQLLDKNDNIIPFSEFKFNDYGEALKYLNNLKDSTRIRAKKIIQYDIQNISSSLLIKNIDLAFREWKNNSWSKSYSFETFCEYILPYRNLTEPLEYWREDYNILANNEKYKIDDETDPVAVCTQIIFGLNNFTFVNKRPDPIPILSPSQMLFRRQGSCPDLANFSVLVCRSKGVATALDFTPQYAASSNRHTWDSVIDKNGNHIPFNSNAVNNIDNCLPYIYNANRKRLGKVFRITYSIQKKSLANIIPESNIPEGFLEQKNIKDVTSEYVKISDLSIPKNRFKDSIAYVNVFNLGKWKVIDWASENGGMVTFKNLGRDLVYLPSTFNGNNTIFLRHPFLIDKEGIQHELIPDKTNLFSATLSKSNVRETDFIDFNTLEIIEDQLYKLYCWDNGWKKIGESIAKKEGVYFDNIPSNALFILLPEKKIDLKEYLL
ncbi:transglutaminase-like domain-containing protein [Cellulophaga baltica 4]|nr:transglutaminase-like domain-containing protein [Cellulophaga baltica 4]